MMPGRQTQKIIARIHHIHEKKVKSLQTENKESKRWFASHLTLQIGNLEHKPKASHSQITTVDQ